MAEKRGMPGWMQRAIYLGIVTLSGMLWFPLGQFVNNQYFADNPYAAGNLWIWLPLTGLLTGFTYSVFTHWRDGKEPSPWWFATLVPSFGVCACVTSLTFETAGGMKLDAGDFVMGIIFGNFMAYITLGWLIIPLGVPYVMLVGWLHRETARLAPLATRRHVRHAVWGFAALGLLGFTEVPKIRGYVAHDAYDRAVRDLLPAHLPPGTELVTPRHQDDPEGTRSFWFRSPTALEWPLIADQQPLSNPDDRETIGERAAEVGIHTDDSTRYDQGKWIRNGRTVQVTRVRSGGVDYLEVIPW